MANNRLFLLDTETKEEITLAKSRAGDDAWDWLRTDEEMTIWLDGRDILSAIGCGQTKLRLSTEFTGDQNPGFLDCRICGCAPYIPEPVNGGDHQHHQVICRTCGIEVTHLEKESCRQIWNALMDR
jgi:hypothetical protein